MLLLVLGFVGVCLGVLQAGSRVPQVRWAPMASSTLLGVVTVVVMMQQSELNSLLGGLTFLVGFTLGSMLYAGVLWKREELEPDVTYWGWVWRDFTHAGYLRKVHEAQHNLG